MRRSVLCLVGLLLACGSPAPIPATEPPASDAPEAPPDTEAPAAAEASAEVMPVDVPALAPRDVCVVQADGSLAASTVRGSIAGVYGAEAIRLAMLNWSGASSGGCVSYPGASTRRASCGGEPLPVVAHVLCQQ